MIVLPLLSLMPSDPDENMSVSLALAGLAFVLTIIVLPIISYILFTNGWAAVRFASLTTSEWLAVVLLAAGIFGMVQRIRVAVRLERS